MKQINCFLALFLFCSCAKISEIAPQKVILNDTKYDYIEVIPIEKALSTLDAFLSDNDMLQTKSGQSRTYSNVSIYYGDDIRTKSEPGDTLPTAYVVNFDENNGFAVLGANNVVPDVIAVTESGQINPKNLKVVSLQHSWEDKKLFEDMDDSEIDYFNDNVTVTADTLFYSTEDEDYYIGSTNSDEIATALIHQCIQVSYDQFVEDEHTVDSAAENDSLMQYTTKTPLLTYSWSQVSPYNRYCTRGFIRKNEALTGCSTTAMAMIVAYNEFPQNLTINGSKINYTCIKGGETISDLSESYKDQIALLMGSIFNYVRKVATKRYTLITPKQIAKRMSEFGYDKVNKLNASSLTTSMISEISKMLRNNKPVFISAIPKGIKNWGSGHSWVIDGAKYSSGKTYLLHMNFGWEGTSNGYFATNIINPSNAIEFDDSSDVASTYDYVYNWHFRVITYNVPTLVYNSSISF